MSSYIQSSSLTKVSDQEFQRSIFRLPIRPRPIADELTMSYLVRVAWENGFETPRALWSELARNDLYGTDVFRESLLIADIQHSTLFGVYPKYCKLGLPPPLGLPVDTFHHYRMRWCPLCLNEAPYLRGVWGLKLCCVCISHGLMLVERCPRCHAVQKLERADLAHCSCGFEFARGSGVTAPSDVIDLHSALFRGIQSGSSSVPYSTIEITPANWLKMVRYLGPFAEVLLPERLGKPVSIDELSVAIKLSVGTARLLSKWPENFSALLAAIRMELVNATSISEAFGPLYRVLYRELEGPSFQFLRNAFEDYLHDHWFGLLGRRNRRLRPETITSHNQKPLHQIARVAGVGVATLRHLIKSGVISGNSVSHLSGRTTWAIPAASADQVVQCVEGGLSLLQAAGCLGLNKFRIRELIDAGLIGVSINPNKTGAAAWLLVNADVQRLVAIEVSARPVAEATDKCVKLVTILKAWRLREAEFPALVQALLSHDICVVGHAGGKRGLGGVLMEVETVKAWLEKLRRNSAGWLSIDNVAKVLRVKQQVAYELVARGLLVSEQEDLMAQQHISYESLLAFQRRYISLAKVAKAYGNSPRQTLTAISAKPVCGPTIDGARQYFYRLEDVLEQLSVDHENWR